MAGGFGVAGSGGDGTVRGDGHAARIGGVYPFTSPKTQATSLIQHSFSGWRQKLSKRFV
jgi:hypothetical protein